MTIATAARGRVALLIAGALVMAGATGAGIAAPVAPPQLQFDVSVLPDGVADPNEEAIGFPRLASQGSAIAVSDIGPTVWTSADAGAHWTGRDQPPSASQCGQHVPGPADVAIGSDRVVHATQSCGSGLHWALQDTRWNPRSHGLANVILPDIDGGWVTEDSADPTRLYYVAHDIVGPRGIAGDLFVARSTNSGGTWTPILVNGPHSPGAHRSRINGEGPDLPTRVLIDPRNHGNLLVVWVAESQLDSDQDHADDATDDYEWDTHIFAGRSVDGGLTWRVSKVYSTGQPLPGSPHEAYDDLGGWLPSASFDVTGTAYLTIAHLPPHADQWRMLMFRSLDGGASWSEPQELAGAGSVFAPACVAGAPGRVGLVWYGTSGSAQSSLAQWRLHAGWVSWPRAAAHPVLRPSVVASGVVHTGPLFPIGPRVDAAHRALDVVRGPGGRLITIFNVDRPGGKIARSVARQVGGPTL